MINFSALKNVSIIVFFSFWWLLPLNVRTYDTSFTYQNIIIISLLLFISILDVFLGVRYKTICYFIAIFIVQFVGFGTGVKLFFSACFAALYLYENYASEKKINENIESVFLSATPIAFALSIIINFKNVIEVKHRYPRTAVLLLLFFVLFLCLCMWSKKIRTDKKTKKEFLMIVLVSEFGIVSSASLVNSNIWVELAFFPWLLLLLKMLLRKDTVVSNIFVLLKRRVLHHFKNDF